MPSLKKTWECFSATYTMILPYSPHFLYTLYLFMSVLIVSSYFLKRQKHSILCFCMLLHLYVTVFIIYAVCLIFVLHKHFTTHDHFHRIEVIAFCTQFHIHIYSCCCCCFLHVSVRNCCCRCCNWNGNITYSNRMFAYNFPLNKCSHIFWVDRRFVSRWPPSPPPLSTSSTIEPVSALARQTSPPPPPK